MKVQNERFLKALARQPVDCTPVWIMRQAGRYLPEYRATRSRAGDFLTLCKTPELACEVTLQPLARFDLDAAILFSDILTIPDAMGLGLSLEEGVGPRFSSPIRDPADIVRLGVPDPELELRYVMEAIRLIRQELAGKLPLIGFSGSPWTLATYMVEGQSTRDFNLVKTLIFDNPEAAHSLLSKIADAVTQYLTAQAMAGVDALMIFDTWGGVLSKGNYEQFSLDYMSKIVSEVRRNLSGQSPPIILFTKGGGQWLELIAASNCNGVGLDWTTDIGEARARIGDRCALQGNLDPGILYASAQRITREVSDILRLFGPGNGHIFNLGHGIHPSIDPGKVAALVDAVHELSAPYHDPNV